MMLQQAHFWHALAASMLAALITTAGIYTIRHYAAWGQRNSVYFMCFAAGVLVTAAFLHIIPTSFSMNAEAPAWLVAGFFGMYLVSRFLKAYVCHKQPAKEQYGIGLVPMTGIGFHSLVDGMVYSVAFTVSAFTGLLATIGLVLHEFPEGIITYLLLLKGGFSDKTAMWLALAAAAFTTPLGMLASYPLVNASSQQALGALLALSAGMLVYVGATHLLPIAEQEQKRFSIVALSGGILVAVLMVLAK